MEPIHLFLDTEWADTMGSELVSLALISEDGQHVFYSERQHLSENPTDFVRAGVYPLLDRNEAAMSDADMTTALRRFLSDIHAPHVLADHPIDLQLLKFVLAGFDLPDPEATACGPVPTPAMTLISRDGLITLLLEDWFSAHPDQAARRHHALVDAHALRMAWLGATRRIEPYWSNLGKWSAKPRT